MTTKSKKTTTAPRGGKLDKKKLQIFKDKLLQAKSAILKELEIEQEFLITEDNVDLVDKADEVIHNELLSRLSDMEIQRIRMIDRALDKIEDGTYGICEGTQKPIPEARLNAIPWTPYTVDYAEQLEKIKK